ncbi:MAG: Cys-tRNA(Pro) deacylase [Spirochaetales bacterium]|nr:Cys-tRNA(Pro) deacylase [Spirochaetales bacterium]MBR2316536.1 Cys-tRNA(Pro) deacylase [Spirochaetales bacterium]
MATKTNAARLLDTLKLPYELISYEVDEEHLDAIHVAQTCGQNVDQVFKTLVANGDKNGINVFCIPGAYDLDLKKAAAISGNKNVEMVKVKDLFALTGYIRGGCSPLGMKKKYPVFIDETAQLHDIVFVSGGLRGLQIKIAPDNLAIATDATFADLLHY